MSVIRRRSSSPVTPRGIAIKKAIRHQPDRGPRPEQVLSTATTAIPKPIPIPMVAVCQLRSGRVAIGCVLQQEDGGHPELAPGGQALHAHEGAGERAGQAGR